MKLSHQQVNPRTGGGSYLLRLRDDARDTTACLLVDSGTGVDLDAMLGPDEHLAGVLLTHAHLDHYGTLADSLRDGAPVYASEATAAILEDVLSEGEKNYDLGASEGVVDALEPLDDWTTVFPDVEACPVPAGHAPGASGFVVRFHDGNRANHVLFTGDFTTRRVAGYPSFAADLPVDIDALFVNVSTTEAFESTLSDSLDAIVERSRAGSKVLATASALTGIHYAYLLGHLGDQVADPIPVTLVGQAAKLYDDLGYDVPNVETVPVFEDTDELLERGSVTLAGPEVPVEGSSRRLFRTVRDDSTATLVQITGGATDPVETAACTVYDYEVVNHPSPETIDELVERLNPIHVVVGHGPRRTVRNYRGRYDERFVWASDDDQERTLYENGQWSPPPWLSENAVQSIRAQDWRSTGGRFGEFADDADDSMPPVSRVGDADLDAEGVEVERFERRFGGPETGELEPTDSETADPVGSDAVESDAEASDSATSDADTVERAVRADGAAAETDLAELEDGQFRREVLDRLASLESAVAGSRLRARVVDGGEDVTLLRLLDDADFEHGEELTVAVPDDE